MSKQPVPNCADDAPRSHGTRESWPSDFGAQPQKAGTLAADLEHVLTKVAGHLALAERHAAGNTGLIRLLDRMRTGLSTAASLAEQIGTASSSGIPSGWAEELSQLMPPASVGRILVVEDDPQVAEVAVAVLEDLGHQVDHRPDAASALALLQENRFDLVFSDIVMPGMSGIELADAISSSFPSLPVLLATGYSSAALAQGAMRFPILAKPYSVQELSRRITSLLP